MQTFMLYTDKEGNNYRLSLHPYIKGNDACAGCAFKFGNSKACQAAKSCTPTLHNGGNRQRLLPAGYVWKQVN